MKRTGVMVTLSTRQEVILARTQGRKHRPLLNVDEPIKKIEELLKVRKTFYDRADYTIDSSDLQIREVVDKVLQIARKKSF